MKIIQHERTQGCHVAALEPRDTFRLTHSGTEYDYMVVRFDCKDIQVRRPVPEEGIIVVNLKSGTTRVLPSDCLVARPPIATHLFKEKKIENLYNFWAGPHASSQ